MRRAVALLVAVLAGAAALPAAAVAQDCPRTTLADVEDEVMCPVCGTPLALATEAPQAQQERAYIERLIADCRSKEQVKRALVAQFGEGVLALPGDESGDDDLEDLLVYAIPALAILGALGGIAFALRRWRRQPPPAANRAQPAGPSDPSGRVDADMERYDL
jgi:cytochrome c-type biogenesis protein CcmH